MESGGFKTGIGLLAPEYMARIDLRQLDDFSPTLLEDIINGQSIRWDAANTEFVAYSPYGSVSFEDKKLTPTSTTATSFVNHQTWNTPVLAAGVYAISWNIVWYTTNQNAQIEILVEEGANNLAPVNFRDSTSQSTDRRYVNYVTTITLPTPRALNLKISLRRQGSNQAVVIEASELTVFTVGNV